MAEKFPEFLAELATNPKALADFIRSPDAAMDAAGLTRAEKAILKSGNAQLIHLALYGNLPILPMGITVMLAPTFVPMGHVITMAPGLKNAVGEEQLTQSEATPSKTKGKQ